MPSQNNTQRRIFNRAAYKSNDLISRFYGKLECDKLFSSMMGKKINFDNHSHKLKVDLVGSDVDGKEVASLDVEGCKNWVGETPKPNWEPYLYQRKLKLFSNHPETFYWLKFNKDFSYFILLSINDFDGAVMKMSSRNNELLMYPKEEVWRNNIYKNTFKDKSIEKELLELNTNDVKYVEECEILQEYWEKIKNLNGDFFI